MNKHIVFCGGCLFLLCIGFSPVQTIHAGEINAAEQKLINAAEQEFTYEGKTYRVSNSYVEQLKSYLSRDGVDLSASQCESQIAKIHSNVELGVLSGYLYEVKESSDAQKVEAAAPEEEKSDNAMEKKEVEQEPNQQMKEEAKGDSKETISEKSPTPIEQEVENNKETDRYEEKQTAKEEKEDTAQSTENAKIETDSYVTADERESVLIIKETGFSIRDTIIAGVILGTILFLNIGYALKKSE